MVEERENLINIFNGFGEENNCDIFFYNKIAEAFATLRPFWEIQDLSQNNGFWRNQNTYISSEYTKYMVGLVNSHVKEKLELSKDDVFKKWSISLYFCGEESLVQDKYEISFSCKLNEDEKYFVDRYGNFYLSKEKFLSTLPYKFYHTHSAPDSVKNIPNDNLFVQNIKDGLSKMFDSHESFGQFLEEAYPNDEGMLKAIKIIYPLFSVLLTPNLPSISFKITHPNRGNFTIEFDDEGTKWEFDTERENNKKFGNFKIFVENKKTTCAFSQKCQKLLNEAKKNKLIFWHTLDHKNKKKIEYHKELEEYKWKINDRCENEDITINCHKLAFEMLKDNPELQPEEKNDTPKNQNFKPKKCISLRQLKYIIFWIQNKVTSHWPGLKDAERAKFFDSKVKDFREQYKKLFEISKIFEQTTCRFQFPNLYSAAYHLNQHYNDTKIVIDSFETSPEKCPANTINQLINLKEVSDNLELQENMKFKKESNINNMTLETLRNCATFYFDTVSSFLFNGWFDGEEHIIMGYYTVDNIRDYTSDNEENFKSKEYIAGHLLKGIISYEKILTIHGDTGKKNTLP